ncbi:MAG: T9SS type A sorting domain-containing protein [Cyclonatronaceae bacterium]
MKAKYISRNVSLSVLPNYLSTLRPTTQIKYNIPEAGKIQLVILDLMGNEIQWVYDGYQSSGEHHLQFDASGFLPGIYLYRLSVGTRIITKRILLV